MKKGKWLVPIMLIAAICAFAAACGGNKHTHTYGEAWEITAEPTETTGGKAKHVCTGCNEAEEVDIPALSDTTVWTEDTAAAVPATHTSTGSKKYASVYGTVIITVPAVPHVFTDAEWTILAQPTKTAEGKAKATCVECHNDGEIVLPALTDSVWRGYGITAATCTEAGEQRYIADKLYGIVAREPIP
ncbi:MAG: hypothetical protein K2L51_03370, partial [Clostridiales bacterium]|nr:hypothetical protein [Clostridiales bacterium]